MSLVPESTTSEKSTSSSISDVIHRHMSHDSRLTFTRCVITILTLLVVSLVTLIGCLRVGVEPIGFTQAARILFRLMQDGGATIHSAGPAAAILVQVRLPRVLLGFMVGGSLAAVG